jgi:DNA mismatch endonuclease (patch repair protein)
MRGMKPEREKIQLNRSTKRHDMFTIKKRSEIMAKIRSKYSKLDMAMKNLLVKNHIKFMMYPDIYGKPDFLLPTKIAIFCDSSFWHGRNWPALKKVLMHGSHATYWVNHIMNNRRRDSIVNRRLRREGFVVLRFWDTEIRSNPSRCMKRIQTNQGIWRAPKGN